MDSLRYWVTEMHVDGFRFDLASTLARDLQRREQDCTPFFEIIHQDPVLSQMKLIAEPWDVGEGGYQVGNFPVPVGGVERQISRRGQELLERRRGPDRRDGLPADRAARIFISTTAAARTPA